MGSLSRRTGGWHRRDRQWNWIRRCIGPSRAPGVCRGSGEGEDCGSGVRTWRGLDADWMGFAPGGRTRSVRRRSVGRECLPCGLGRVPHIKFWCAHGVGCVGLKSGVRTPPHPATFGARMAGVCAQGQGVLERVGSLRTHTNLRGDRDVCAAKDVCAIRNVCAHPACKVRDGPA